MDAFAQDLRYAVRTLLKSRGFALVAITTLALGIGATTAIFSVVDGVMLRPLPYPDTDRIVIISETTRSGQAVSWPNFEDWRSQNRTFEALGIYRAAAVNLTGIDVPMRLDGAVASAEVFRALGITPLAGRTFSEREDRPGADPVAIVSERLWRSRFAADPGLIGRTVTLNDQAHTVVGIMPATMRFPSRLTDVWLPIGTVVATFPPRGAHPGLTAVAKLKADVTFAEAVAEMDTVSRRLEQEYPDTNTNTAASLARYYEAVVGNIRPALLVLLAAVALVLLIGCVNLANLMLAKSEMRQREVAVRSALGATRGRIVQQLFTESLLLAAIGGALGSLLAWWSVDMFVASHPSTVPRIDLVAVDGRVLVFAALVSIATALLFGVVPAWRAAASGSLSALKEAHVSSSPAARRVRGALVTAEVGLAMVLLVAAGLMIRSFANLTAVDPGFNADRVITVRLTLPPSRYPSRERWTRFHDDLVRRVAALPAIEAAAVNSAVPLEGGGSEAPVIAEGWPMPSRDRPGTMCLFQATSADYFHVMGIEVVSGRVFSERDSESTPAVAVVDESLAHKLFPGGNAVGKRIAFEFSGHGAANARPIWREVVGVVRHVRHYGLASEPPFVQVYAPYRQLPLWMQERRPTMALLVRTGMAPDLAAASIRRAVSSVDPDIPVYGLQTMTAYIAQSTEQPRLSVVLLSLFGGLALALAAIGVYGVLSYAAAQRTREIGIRMALGATHAEVLRLVLGEGMALAGIGLALGLTASVAASRALASMLVGVSPRDPVTFAAMAGLLGGVALAASYLPGRRAARVSPVEALRAE